MCEPLLCYFYIIQIDWDANITGNRQPTQKPNKTTKIGMKIILHDGTHNHVAHMERIMAVFFFDATFPYFFTLFFHFSAHFVDIHQCITRIGFNNIATGLKWNIKNNSPDFISLEIYIFGYWYLFKKNQKFYALVTFCLFSSFQCCLHKRWNKYQSKISMRWIFWQQSNCLKNIFAVDQNR